MPILDLVVAFVFTAVITGFLMGRVRHVQASGPTGHEIGSNHTFLHIWICHALPVVYFRKKV
jgi:hypothetical protein